MAQSGCRDTDGMGELECDAAPANGNGGGSQKTGNQSDVSDRIGAQVTSVEKEENRTAPRANSFEFALSKAESAEARESPDQDQGECRDGERHQENAKQAFKWNSMAKHGNPESVFTNFFQDLYSIPVDQEEATQSERRHWVELWKNLRMTVQEEC